MKRLIVVFTLMLSSICAGAFEFDGINLNDPHYKVAREISAKGYTYNHERNCLEGVCHGVKLYLSTNYIDVSKGGMVGQLIVNIPLDGDKKTQFDEVTTIFNVIYHQVAAENGTFTYEVDKDGTQLMLSHSDEFITLTYNTPYYSKRKSKK